MRIVRLLGALTTGVFLVSAAAGMGPPRATGTGTAPATAAPPAPAKKATKESYRIDPVHSMALFRVRHLNAGAFWGRFNDVRGSIEFDPSSDRDLKMDVVMDITSLDTGSENLDKHVKSEDFFFAEKHPKATFVSTSARRTGTQTYEVTGDLTMRGVSRTITTDVEWLGTADGPHGRRGGFETTFTVRRSDFGIDYGVEGGVLGDETRLIIAMEGRVGGPDRGGRGEGRGPGQLLDRLDKNEDGKIQKNELPERMRDRFDEIDANGDGAIDEHEIGAMSGGRGGAGRRPGGRGQDSGSGGGGAGGG